jgi:hypothetical protein
VVTANDLISIGIAIGNSRPSFIVSGTKFTKLDLDGLLNSFGENEETKSLPLLIIGNEGENIDSLVGNYKNERSISVLYEPLDIHQFKREVENIS